ncbi:hypothetical protein T484DRAFT_1840372 [Baffinella frigidus]|nr:hypothetical protein T484DRAFT_1840372 [Cryptophyta sp. CCMP2293]
MLYTPPYTRRHSAGSSRTPAGNSRTTFLSPGTPSSRGKRLSQAVSSLGGELQGLGKKAEKQLMGLSNLAIENARALQNKAMHARGGPAVLLWREEEAFMLLPQSYYAFAMHAREDPAVLLWREEEAFMLLPQSYYAFVRKEAHFIRRLIDISQEAHCIRRLVDISQELCDVDPPSRLAHLKNELEALNASLLPSTSAFIPLCTASEPVTAILRILPEESFVFSTRERAPYMMCLEEP